MHQKCSAQASFQQSRGPFSPALPHASWTLGRSWHPSISSSQSSSRHSFRPFPSLRTSLPEQSHPQAAPQLHLGPSPHLWMHLAALLHRQVMRLSKDHWLTPLLPTLRSGLGPLVQANLPFSHLQINPLTLAPLGMFFFKMYLFLIEG